MLEHQRLLDQLCYDQSTGVFLWNVTRNRIAKETQAGCLNKEGYRIIKLDGATFKAHRLAWFYVHGVWPTGIIDHKDGNGDHNWISNLRDTSQAVNCENKKKARKKDTSTLMGVSYISRLKKYKATITVRGVNHYLGLHLTEKDAHEAYMIAKRKHHVGFV